MEKPIFSYELEDYLDIGDGTENVVQATNMLSWDTESDKSEYTAECLDYIAAKTWVLGRTCKITAQQIAMHENDLTDWIMKHEDDTDVPTKIYRVKAWTADANGECQCKMAAFKFNPDEPVKEFNSALKIGGGFERADDDWTFGTFNRTTKVFTPATAEPETQG